MEITPEQFNNLATKDDLKEMEERLVTKNEFYRLEGEVNVLKEDVTVLKSDVAVLKSDVAVLKVDVAVLKSDVAVLKVDVAELKVEFRDFKEEMNEKFDIVIGMLEEGSKEKKEHKMEHVANIAAHDRFQGEIDQIKTQIQAPASV